MEPASVFRVAWQHSQWLSAKHSTIAQNIANANTPGYTARTIAPFESALESAQFSMSSTQPNHLKMPVASSAKTEVRSSSGWEVTHSGNSVSLEKELMEAGRVRGAYALNSNVVKVFHRMLIASAKG